MTIKERKTKYVDIIKFNRPSDWLSLKSYSLWFMHKCCGMGNDYYFVENLITAGAKGSVASSPEVQLAMQAATLIPVGGQIAQGINGFFSTIGWDFGTMKYHTESDDWKQKLYDYKVYLAQKSSKIHGINSEWYIKIMGDMIRLVEARPKCQALTENCAKEHINYTMRVKTTLESIKSFAQIQRDFLRPQVNDSEGGLDNIENFEASFLNQQIPDEFLNNPYLKKVLNKNTNTEDETKQELNIAGLGTIGTIAIIGIALSQWKTIKKFLGF